MIRRIELVNFMSHDRTVIEPADGLTVLVGPNNCGKSAIVNALMILCHNDNSTYVTRHNEKCCSVIVTTGEDDVVEWRRSNNSPKYIINGNLFDRLGRDVPDELHKVLRLPRVTSEGAKPFDVHFGEQKSPVFLLDEPGTRAAQFFAASSDAAKLVEMQRLHRHAVGRANDESAQLLRRSAQLNEELASLSATDPLGVAVRELETQHKLLAEDAESMEALAGGIRQLEAASAAVVRRSGVAEAYSALTPPPTLADPTPLVVGIEDLVDARATLAEETARADALAPLVAVPVLEDEERLEADIRTLHQARQGEVRLGARCGALAQLSPPPEMCATAALAAAISEMVALRQHAQTLERTAMALASLSPVPTLTDTRECERVLGELRRAVEAVSVRAREQAEAARELREFEVVMRRDLEGCICPTCRAPMDADRLMEHSAPFHGAPGDA